MKGKVLRLVLKLANEPNGATGMLISLDQGNVEIPVSTITQNELRLKLIVSMVSGTEVYSWRVSSATESRLEEAARRERRTVAEILDEIVTGHLSALERQTVADADRQRDLHARAARFAGRLSGADPHRSADARPRVRARLVGRRHRAR